MLALPLSAVVPTRNRAGALSETLSSLEKQNLLPAEMIIVDASDNGATKKVVSDFENRICAISVVQWTRAISIGAAAQRNQGVAMATQPFVWFFDDDIRFEPNCTERLWTAIKSDPQLGGVNAMIINQQYHSPGFVSRVVFTVMHGRREKSFAGKIIGPAINLLPEDREDLPEVVPVEWLNTTCTMYRREALPNPPFDPVFTGYSLMEDVALSLRVGKEWKLANARKARIVHESQSGDHKSEARLVARMEVINRYYVMRNILDQRGALSVLRLFVWQLFQLASVAARSSTRRNAVPILLGQAEALEAIILRRKE